VDLAGVSGSKSRNTCCPASRQTAVASCDTQLSISRQEIATEGTAFVISLRQHVGASTFRW
jgi:hypothetical protein